MKVKLEDVAEVRMGLVLSRKKAELSSASKYPYGVVSLRSFNENGIYEYEYADEFVSAGPIKDEFLVKESDILLRLREPNYAVYIGAQYENLVYSSLTVRIRLKDNRFDSNFIAMYLNGDTVKKQLSSALSGSQIAMVKVSDINNIDISAPSIEMQKKIVEYSKLSSRELQLLQKLVAEKSKLSKQIFEKLVETGE